MQLYIVNTEGQFFSGAGEEDILWSESRKDAALWGLDNPGSSEDLMHTAAWLINQGVAAMIMLEGDTNEGIHP